MASRAHVLTWIALALVALALLYFGAVRSYRRSGLVRKVALALLGPPARQLEEAYSAEPARPDVDHALWNALLGEHVDGDGWVDYEGLVRDVERLDRYLAAVAQAPFDEFGRDAKLALLVNAYNAFTVKLVTEHYPIPSIRDIPAEGRWEARRWELGGRTWSLAELEHDEIRPRFAEPRIHFALVCAAVGCPPLAREAYVAERLDEQLEDRARYVHGHGTWFRFDEDAGRVELTELYSWYAGDFEQVAGSALAYAARYDPRLARALAGGTKLTVRWIPYDWNLNATHRRAPR